MEFIQWSKDNSIPVAPGRGWGQVPWWHTPSRSQDLRPAGIDLLFERFLNPERLSMPDFDMSSAWTDGTR
ncbi:hypothetical protein ACNKHX_01140 [Shigella flexneri]